MTLKQIGTTASALLALATTLVAAAPLRAQDSTKTLFDRRDLVVAGGFAALTVAMFPVDRHLARTLRDSSLQANRVLRSATKGFENVADPGSIVIGVSMYAVGRVAGWHDVADLGLHGTEAVVLAGATTTVLKGVLGRARPYISADTNPHDFKFGRGFRGNQYESFPSGHTTVAFAAAAAVTSESRRWWPHETWLVAPAMYGGATLVGLSRIYHDAHWASDVALGAAVGTFSGLKVVRYAHAHPDNRVDRILLPRNLAMGADGREEVVWGWSF